MKLYSEATSRKVAFDDDDDHSFAVSSSAGSDGNDDIESVATAKEDYARATEEQEEIAKSETKAVFWLRLAVMLVLTLSALSVALTVYFYTSGSEQDEFETQFTSDSVKVLESVGLTLDTTFGAADAFVLKLVAYARYSNSTWPYVTLPNHAVHAAKLLSLSKAFYVSQSYLVSEEQRDVWEPYSAANDFWVYEGIEVEKKDARFDGLLDGPILTSPYLYDTEGIRPEGLGPYLPSWQKFPVLPNPYDNMYNFEGFSMELTAQGQRQAMTEKRVVVSHFGNVPDLDDPFQVAEAVNTAAWGKRFIDPEDESTEPMSAVYYPIIDAVDSIRVDVDQDQPVVGVLTFILYWRELINNILPANSNGVIVVVENACDQVFTYQLNGPDTVYLGRGDQHDPKYDHLGKTSSLFDLMDTSKLDRKSSYTGIPVTEEFCPKTLSVYPSQEMEDHYVTSLPILLTVAAALIFVFTSMVFFLYDWLVERRQKKVMRTAVQSSAIVSSLFPSQVRDRLFPMDVANADTAKEENPWGMESVHNKSAKAASSPVADLYPEATVMFADIAGFTAWSSVREPKQVFTLLETLYGAFDAIADRRGVFKVETIGDSYVAVVGLPEPRKDHAVVMARFARDCRNDMSRLTRELEITLGPDTNELQLRFGLHSGPVTAGVLRGQKSRFQLFGDTVNTAARMESNGIRNRIQVSQTTADLLIAAGKEHWVAKRDELVSAKGKGKMQTYWVEPKNSSGGSVTSAVSHPNQSSDELSIIDDKTQRLVDWNSEVLGRLTRQIVAKRNASLKGTTSEASSKDLSSATILPIGATVLDEVKEIIELPEFDADVVRNQEDPDSIELDNVVLSQLREYVVTVATMHRENPFHNFEHASHVAMSVVKLLSCKGEALSGVQQNVASSLRHNTYGIMGDPLTQFACVFSALIHDVDHPGVPNTQLVKENLHIAGAYKGKSVAEQNSVDLTWSAFMDERFIELRKTLCATEEEMGRFRQLVVNSVMATDIMDKELKTLRNARWDRAFLEAPRALESDHDKVNRKATTVIEHMMQASDIAHTMQHFDIYQKWNELLFTEMYAAYLNGRGDKDPSESWYRSELGFFDFCIIPLATKLRDCGAFGASSDEYLACAVKNRQEWEAQGQEVVASMLEKYRGKGAVQLVSF